MYHTQRALALCGLLTACEADALVGQVVDNFGAPVPGAELAVAGSTYTALADVQGRFELDYAPGHFEVIASAPGHVEARAALDLDQQVRYPMAPIELVRLPPPGLYAQGIEDYLPLTLAAFQTRERTVDRTWQARCRDALLPTALTALSGDGQRLFVPADPERVWALVAPGEGGVLSSTPLHMMANCVGSAPDSIQLEWRRAGGHQWAELALPEGDYCLTQLRETFLGSAVGSEGACFHVGDTL